MVSPDVVRKRLRLLEGYLKKLKRIRETTDLAKFLADDDLQDIVDRNFQLAIEAVLDIGQHIIASSGWELIDDYADVFAVLEKHKVISTDLAERVEKMAGFRNILVHEYADIEHSQVFEALQNNLKDLEGLTQAYQEFLESQE